MNKKQLLSALFVVGGLQLAAQPGSGIKTGANTVWIPEVELSANYSDNIDTRASSVGEAATGEDSYFESLFALTLRHMGGENNQVYGRGFWSYQAYQDNSELDAPEYGVTLGTVVSSRSGRSTVKLEGLAQHAVDDSITRASFGEEDASLEPLEAAVDRVKRDEFGGYAFYDQAISRLLGIALKYGYTDVDYEQDFNQDKILQDFSVQLYHQSTPKVRSYLETEYNIEENDSLRDDANTIAALGGFIYEVTSKVNLDLAVGFEQYDRKELVGEDFDENGFKFRLTGTWFPTPKLIVSASGDNGFESGASAGSARETTGLVASVIHQSSQELSQTLMASYTLDDYLADVTTPEGLIDEETETLYFLYRLDYTTPKSWLKLFFTASYEDGSSEIPNNSYNTTEVGIGLSASY